jgi:hypothetical protein
MFRRCRRSGLSLLVGVIVASALLVPTAGAVDTAGPFTAGGSINQVYTYGHPAGTQVTLRDAAGEQVQAGLADEQGAHLFKGVPKGAGFVVETAAGRSAELTVTDPGDHPSASHYESQPDLQLVPSGPSPGQYGYLPTRDGTTLSVNVLFPSGPGPWPVVVNYNGYDPSNPEKLPSEVLPYLVEGYVVVGVNMRGSGCSGGAFDFFEPAQSTDGYDVIETLANQPWSNGDVGMIGISYGGYSQLYVGATRPPHLRALTVLSPYDDTYRSILYPGGILNDGFALEWASERAESTKPNNVRWVNNRIAAGDAECAKNQLLRGQNRDMLASIRAQRFVTDEFAYLNTKTFVDKIEVPTYLAAQFQDEQTGGHAATLFDLFAPGTEVQATFTNGTHVEPYGPTEFVRAMAFIDFYVGKRVPTRPPVLDGLLADGLSGIFGAEGGDLPIPPNPWAGVADYDDALAWFEAQPPVRIRWENGGVAGKENLPFETATTYADSWPVPSVEAEAHYLQPDGRLGPTAPSISSTSARSRSSYRYDPSTKADQTYQGSRDDIWKRHAPIAWAPLPEGDALSYLTEPFTTTAAYAGSGSVDLWLRSNAADTDLEATLTEVRPDGSEVFIQSGWLRASPRRLDQEKSTELLPHHTHLEADARPLPRDRFEPVRVEIFPFAHVVRPGSRLRLNIEAPSGNQPFWSFDTLASAPVDGSAEVRNEIGHATVLPSRVVLPRLPAEASPDVPATAPSCHVEGVTSPLQSLRNQPCRDYVAPRIPTGVSTTRLPNEDLGISWTAPPGPEAPTGYQVQVVQTGEVLEVPAGTTTATLHQPVPRARYEFTVRARYGDVLGPASDASPLVKARPAPASAGAIGGPS